MSTFVAHNLCEHCWWKLNPARRPIRVKQDVELPDVCCSCGCPTITGIFVRGEATEYKCTHAKPRLSDE